MAELHVIDNHYQILYFHVQMSLQCKYFSEEKRNKKESKQIILAN